MKASIARYEGTETDTLTVAAINSRQFTSANDRSQVYRSRVPYVVTNHCSIYYASCRMCRSRGRDMVLEVVTYRSMSPSIDYELPVLHSPRW
jgi:hypothetical protein